jgi:hypothetical protein
VNPGGNFHGGVDVGRLWGIEARQRAWRRAARWRARGGGSGAPPARRSPPSAAKNFLNKCRENHSSGRCGTPEPEGPRDIGSGPGRQICVRQQSSPGPPEPEHPRDIGPGPDPKTCPSEFVFPSTRARPGQPRDVGPGPDTQSCPLNILYSHLPSFLFVFFTNGLGF